VYLWGVGRILAIDYGEKRTGLAWTDPLQQVALPLSTVPTEALWSALQPLLPEIEKVIIGYPRQPNGQSTAMTPLVEAFRAELCRRYPHLTVEYVDERFSTYAAAPYVRALPARHRRDKGTYDRIAASLLLANYLLRRR
jgi:putative Holliday junction resolvase